MKQLELDLNAAKIFNLRALRSKKRRGQRASSAHAGEIVVFPILRRTNFNRSVAVGLDARHGDERETYWAEACMELAAQLRRAQQPEDAVAGFLYSLQHAVQRELNRTNPAEGSHREGGPA